MEQNQEKPLELEGNFKTAKELGLTEEQRCGLVKTLAYIEAGKTTHINYPQGLSLRAPPSTYRFNMMVWCNHFSCGTVACIGGTAELLGETSFPRNSIPLNLRALFGIVGNEFKDMGDITERQAGVALRGYLETGKTDWSAARKSSR